MFCKNCGTKIEEDARYCPSCGFDQKTPFKAGWQSFSEDRPRSYLVLSVIVTVLFFFPFGLVGLIYGLKVDSAWNAGYYEDARRFSRKARSWSLWGLGISIGFYLLILLSWLIFGLWFLDLATLDDTFFTGYSI